MNNYCTTANLHTLHINKAHAKPSQSASTSRVPVADLHNGDYSASVLTSLMSGEYPIAELLPQLTNSQAGGHLTPTSYSSLHRLTYKWLLFRVRVRITLRLAVYRQSVRLGVKSLQAQTSDFFFQMNTCRNSPYVTSSLTRGWVYCLAGPRQRSHSRVGVPRDSWSHFTVSDSRLPQPEEPSPRNYIHQEQGGTIIPPGTGFPFRRLLQLAGLRWRYSTPPPHWLLQSSKFKVTLRLGVYRQSVCLGVKPRETHDQNPPPNWIFAILVLTYHPLWREDGFVCYEYAWPFVKCTFRTYSMLLKFFCFCTTHKSCQYRLCRTDHAYLTYLMLQRLPSHLNGRKLDHRQV
jgi:hypothetical protein